MSDKWQRLTRGCREIVDVIKENQQIVIRNIDKDKAYTFNYALPTTSTHEEVYQRCVQPLILNLFKGYNVTILAYGQTGSGKTHTMGTAYAAREEDMGVIPRAVNEIFGYMKDNFSFDFTITVSFIELYQEVLYDLLSDKPREQCVLEIREDVNKGILIPNLTEIKVDSVRAILDTLQRGSSRRATSTTAMNAHSSRSHAIVTVNISMNSKQDGVENKQAKLHLVDLAGSERPKKTGAVGNTFKEGVNINKGLFVLGNVISCLGDEKAQHGFVPYRDSNLTRLLKDSLGGNSITLMIACISPADYNLEETVSTLRYADRARKIKNKPIVNQDPHAAEINLLKKTIQQLRLQIVGQGGPVVCPVEIEALKRENMDLKAKKRDLSIQLASALFDNTNLHEKIMILQNAYEVSNKKLVNLKDQCDATVISYVQGLEMMDNKLLTENLDNLRQIQEQFTEIKMEQKKVEDEIATHDDNKHIQKDYDQDDKEQNEDIEEKQESHTNRQLNLNVQLTDIEKQLNLKENLAKHLISNNKYIVDHQALAENEYKIAQLEKEKGELMQTLKNIGNSEKLSEQRRKRVQELEQQLTILKKKVQEQNQVMTLKMKAEERIRLLNQEIIEMKQMKVRLVKTMREESEKFRQWKLQKERECIRLKRQDIKKENEIVRMKVMHSKQQNVFKRRVEEAEAVNKRLKLALSVKQQAQESRNTGKGDRIESWLKQEFDLYVNLIEAESTLKVLLDDRATLQSQLDEMKSNSDIANTSECKSIEDDLEIRSVQIMDLQQKLLDSDSKAKIRIDKFQTMTDAKFGIKFLFARAADLLKEKVSVQMKLTELQELYNETLEKLEEIKKTHNEEVVALNKSFDQNMSLLCQIPKNDNLSKEEEWQTQLDVMKKENEELKDKLSYLYKIAKNTPATPTHLKPGERKFESNRTFLVTEDFHHSKSKTPVVEAKKTIVDLTNVETPIPEAKKIVMENSLDSSVDDIYGIDDTEKDPDWKKTPLGKRILEEKRKLARTNLTSGEDNPIKRSSQGGCTCKTHCKDGRCGCKKSGKKCDVACRCLSSQCENREKVDNLSQEEAVEEFVKPSDIENQRPRKRLKKTRNLFSSND